jgi:hypothetical protein
VAWPLADHGRETSVDLAVVECRLAGPLTEFAADRWGAAIGHKGRARSSSQGTSRARSVSVARFSATGAFALGNDTSFSSGPPRSAATHGCSFAPSGMAGLVGGYPAWENLNRRGSTYARCLSC